MHSQIILFDGHHSVEQKLRSYSWPLAILLLPLLLDKILLIGLPNMRIDNKISKDITLLQGLFKAYQSFAMLLLITGYFSVFTVQDYFARLIRDCTT